MSYLLQRLTALASHTESVAQDWCDTSRKRELTGERLPVVEGLIHRIRVALENIEAGAAVAVGASPILSSDEHEIEPDHDDTVRCCPDCERPNQFGEVCQACMEERTFGGP